MNMLPNDEQTMLRDALARFLRERVTLEQLRTAASSALPFDPRLWQEMVDLGVTGIMVPQSYGGIGLQLQDAVAAAQEIGAAATPVPFVGPVVMATQALLLAASDAQRHEWLPRIANGQVRMAVAFASGLGSAGSAGMVTLRADRVSADIEAVIDADSATHLLLYLADGRAALVDATQANIEPRASVDALRRISRVRIDGAPAQILVPEGDSRASALRVLDAGRLALAGDTFGAAQTMLDKSVAHARERVQFGRPIGTFQGVKHACADMVTQLEPCRALLWYGASLHATPSVEARVSALQAKAHLGDVAREVSRMAVEVHGGVGFTDMLGLPFWFTRIACNRQWLGRPEDCRAEAGRIQGWTP